MQHFSLRTQQTRVPTAADALPVDTQGRGKFERKIAISRNWVELLRVLAHTQHTHNDTQEIRPFRGPRVDAGSSR